MCVRVCGDGKQGNALGKGPQSPYREALDRVGYLEGERVGLRLTIIAVTAGVGSMMVMGNDGVRSE